MANHINELFKDPKQDFINHLNIPDNSRIIFSGIYGIGKSYFLHKFFEEEKRKYEVIRLQPVNYSINNTEDIFKYIKHDLLCELLAKGYSFDNLDLGTSHHVTLYLQQNWKSVALNVFKMIGKIYKEDWKYKLVLDPLIKFFANGYDHYKNKKKEIEEQYNEADIIDSFLNEMQDIGSLYEENIITQIIEKKINKFREQNPGKEVLLIIDDLDRIDPEHIFRILNIFAAHFENIDPNNTPMRAVNRFSFDRIILVCDINNIRNIYRNRYGADVDFNGYIDKFYSNEVFQFDIRHLISSIVYKVTADLQLGSKHIRTTLQRDEDQALHYLIKALFKRNAVNLRSFLKFYETQHEINFPNIYLTNFNLVDPTRNHLLWQLLLLKSFIGDRHSLQHAISKLTLRDIVDPNFDTEKVFKQLLIVATIPQHYLGSKENVSYELDENITFRFTLKDDRIYQLIYDGIYENRDEERDPANEVTDFHTPFIPLLNKCISDLIELNIL